MDYLSHLLFGFIFAAISIILPGLVNMTSVSVSLKDGIKAGFFYSLGAACTILIQAVVAVTFADYLSEHPEIFTFLKKIALVVFLALGGFFLFKALKPKVAKASNRTGLAFWIGFAVAGMNVLNIAYYFTVSTFLAGEGYIYLEQPYNSIFIAGIPLGAFMMLFLYARFAQFIANNSRYFTRNINYFLSGLFFILAFVQLFQLFL